MRSVPLMCFSSEINSSEVFSSEISFTEILSKEISSTDVLFPVRSVPPRYFPMIH